MANSQAWEIGTLAQWAGACATFLAVLVALFKNEIAVWWHRPKLRILAVTAQPHCQIIPVHWYGTPARPDTNILYIRIQVENYGRTRADRVQVYVARLFRRNNANGEFRADPNFLPMNLLWTHYEAPGGGREIYAEGISPKMIKHCELGHIINPIHRVDWGEDLSGVAPNGAILALDLESPNGLNRLLSSGIYRVEFRVAAANSFPITETLELALTGNWFDDPQKMFADGISMRILK